MLKLRLLFLILFFFTKNSPAHPTVYYGKNAKVGLFPWQVSLVKTDEFGNRYQLCGGSIISSHHILTAAHCLENIKINELSIKAGKDGNWLYLKNLPRPKKFILNPNYNHWVGEIKNA